MVEDNLDQKIHSKRRTYAPVAFGSKVFSPAQLKLCIYSENFLAIYMKCLVLANILWETTAPLIVLTDNKSFERIIQAKAFTPAIWDACYSALQYKLKVAHTAGSVITGSDFFSGLELKFVEELRLKIQEEIQTAPIEVTKSSSDIAGEEQRFFTRADSGNQTDEQTLERKEHSVVNANDCVANEKLASLRTSAKKLTKFDKNTTLFSMEGIRANARIQGQQDVDLVLKHLKLKKSQPYDEVFLTTDRR